MIDEAPFAVGDLVYVTDGAYSNYGVVSVARVLRAFMLEDFQIRPLNPSDVHQWTYDLNRLTAEGFLEEVPAREIYL